MATETPAKKSLWDRHKIFETNIVVLMIGCLLMVSVGGLVEIAPLFYLKSTIEKVEGMRPYSPLELAGRAIYVREGCYNCHSQMVRPMRDEVERYGPYSLAAESMYDHPFQWGSKRTGPDLARVGGKYSDEWQRAHLANPRSIVPDSIMPGYPFLLKAELDVDKAVAEMKVHRLLGVPYTDDQIKNAMVDLKAQVNPDDPNSDAMLKRYPKAQVRDFDGNPEKLTEADALIAYMQMLGTLVDFKLYDNKANLR
ncbi:MAG TPA: cytochrome-c oxidase, cbb3-type subunit II [Beijerinckiaceae bacterium]|nr:cytochrome-c oxidase, cbb3-type subunit II [Beijerinckiaceae bacterium]